MQNSTKIIATLGPSSFAPQEITDLINAGVDCFRVNFSHGDGNAHQPHIDAVRAASKILNVHIPILADIQGPKIRVGNMPREGARLIEGEQFILTGEDVETGSAKIANTSYQFLTRDAGPGTRILLAEGTIELHVEKIQGKEVLCRVITGGLLFSHKGLNMPGTRMSVETLTEKDVADLAFISESDIDMVAISFVRSVEDLNQARRLLLGKKIPVMAKLERPEALENLDAILDASDGVMIARGDLGVEMNFETIPVLQKKILQKAAVRGKWVIVATQMLGSMVNSPRPSRAEVSDVANAVLDGTDAVMLSEETATGKYPTEAVDAMARIVQEAESILPHSVPEFDADIMTFAAGAAGAAVSAAERIHAKAIIALAGSGVTALLLSKWRPSIPILALSAHEPTLRRLNVLRGVIPVKILEKSDMETQIRMADGCLIQKKRAEAGDPVIVVAAIPLGQKKETNTIRFHKVRSQDAAPI